MPKKTKKELAMLTKQIDPSILKVSKSVYAVFFVLMRILKGENYVCQVWEREFCKILPSMW